jgi:enoyl-CoA hydratase/carnithine racemase
MTDPVLVERRGHDARIVQMIRMNRAEKKNALTQAMYRTMADALLAGDADDAVRVHVILGAPGAFSAGNDIGDFIASAMSGAAGLNRPVIDFLMALATIRKPLVTGVDGIAVGIGMTMNLHADLTFATARTNFHTPFVDLGLVPEAGSSLIGPELMGNQRAFALLAAGIPFTAEAAERAGLIHRIVAEDVLEAEVFAAADALAAKPPQALAIARELLRRTHRDAIVARIEEEAKLFGERMQSAEAMAAFQAFMTRKK